MRVHTFFEEEEEEEGDKIIHCICVSPRSPPSFEWVSDTDYKNVVLYKIFNFLNYRTTICDFLLGP